MITIFLKSYLGILLPIGIGSFIIFVAGLLYILGNQADNKAKITNTDVVPDDIDAMDAIAGDDVISTQLDLARAYIETGKNQLAKKILEYVIKEGSLTQKEEAQELSGLI